jgi:eukaryotic-like serine/threonine-protein kinase
MTLAAFVRLDQGRMSEARRTIVDDRYDVGRALGSGGMGEVFLARDRVLGRDVALKVLRRQYAGDSEFAERFLREARSAASLSHPNIVQVYDRGETENGDSYIAMEYVPGGTLKEKISREGPLAASEAAALGAQVAEALGAAHYRGMVHRDIKPQNVLLTERDDAKVADFGIARAGSSVTISKTGSVMGTAGYMSPEQALGEPATPRSDLYSLGVVLYEALTGELPYTADNPIAVSMKHVTEPLLPPREIDPTIPEGMNALVVKLMAKDPEDRYASAAELSEDLLRVGRGSHPAAVAEGWNTHTARTKDASSNYTNEMPPPVRPAPRRRRRGMPWLPIAVGAILLFLGAYGTILALSSDNSNSKNPKIQPAGQTKVRVPEVAGLTRGEAERRLTDVGLTVGQITPFPSDDVAAGRVINTGIDAGTPVKRGTGVNLTLSSGPSQPASSASSSASASAPAQSSPAPGSASAGASASPLPPQQQDRQAAQRRANARNTQGTNARERLPARGQNASAPAAGAAEDNGNRGSSIGNSGSGSGGNSGSGGGRGND